MEQPLIMWIIVLLIALTTNAEPTECKASNDAQVILMQNYPHIQKKLDKWVKPPPHNEVFNSTKDKLVKLLEEFKSSSASQIDKKKVYNFIGSMKDLNEVLAGTRVVTDTVCLKILINFLKCDDEDNAQLAHHILANETGFDALKAQSEQIKLNLKKSYHFTHDIALYSILNLAEKERDSIGRTRNPIQYKANTGDSAALDSLISQYKKAEYDSNKKLFASILMATGQKRAVRAALEDFDKPVYDIYRRKSASCTSSTFQNEIVRKLKRYFPEDTLFSKEYGKMLSVRRDNSPEQHEKVLMFWNKLRNFMLEKYQVKIANRPPYTSIFLSCGPDVSWGSDKKNVSEKTAR